MQQVSQCAQRGLTDEDVSSLEALKGLCTQDEEIIRRIRNEEPRLTEYLFSVIQSQQTKESSNFSVAAVGLLIVLDPEYMCTMRNINDTWVAAEVLNAVATLIREDDLNSVTPDMTKQAIDLAFNVMQMHGDGFGLCVKNGLYVITEAAGCEPPNRVAVEYLSANNICEVIVNLTRSQPHLLADTTKLVIALASVNEVRNKLISLDFLQVLREEVVHTNEYSDKMIRWIFYCIAAIGGPASILDLLHIIWQNPCIERDIRLVRLSFDSLQSHLRNSEPNDAFEDHYIKIIKGMCHALKEVFTQQQDDMLELVPQILGVFRGAVYRQMWFSNRSNRIEESAVLQECLGLVFETMKTMSKNDEVVGAAVEIIGYIIEDNPLSLDLSNQVITEILIEFRNIQAQHISSAVTQHWILWTTLACRGLSTMIEFMNRNETSSAVQEAAISSIVDYFDEDTSMCRNTAAEEQGTVLHVAEMLRQGMQLHYTQRPKGVRALALLCVQCDELPVEIYKFILQILQNDDQLDHRTACVHAIRLLLQKWPTLEVTTQCLKAVNDHLHYSLPAKGKLELFCDGFYILANCQGADIVCEKLNREYARPYLYYCAFRALTDLFRIRGNPTDLGLLPDCLRYAIYRFPRYQDVANSVQLLHGLLGLPSIENNENVQDGTSYSGDSHYQGY